MSHPKETAMSEPTPILAAPAGIAAARAARLARERLRALADGLADRLRVP